MSDVKKKIKPKVRARKRLRRRNTSFLKLILEGSPQESLEPPSIFSTYLRQQKKIIIDPASAYSRSCQEKSMPYRDSATLEEMDTEHQITNNYWPHVTQEYYIYAEND